MADTTGSFAGFGEDLPVFFEGLEADNSRVYWTDHKAVYDLQVRGPLEALLADLEPEFGRAKIFRPHRDVRFSKDKSPYKTAASAVVHGDDGDGSLYVQVDATGLMVGGGYYVMASDQVARYREAVAGSRTGAALVRAITSLETVGWSRGGEQLKRAPRGTDPDHPRIDLLRHKGLAMFRQYEHEDWFFDQRAADVVAGSWRALAPLNRWLAKHVGTSTADRAQDR